MNLVLHAATTRQLEDLAASPSHAILFIGPEGSGKTALMQLLSAQIIDVAAEKLLTYPYYLLLQPAENGTISIEMVRDLQKFLQLKTLGQRNIRRIVNIEHADGLTTEAQNALLKQLEEPPSDTIIMLSAQSKRALLPTIVSRVQLVPVHSPTQESLEEFFSDNPVEDVRKAYFLSGGLPGLMVGILADNQDHPLLGQVSTAKELLQKSAFDRLGKVDALAKQKNILPHLLEALARIAASGLKQAKDHKTLERWHTIQKEVYFAQNALAKSANSKLVLTNLFLNF